MKFLLYVLLFERLRASHESLGPPIESEPKRVCPKYREIPADETRDLFSANNMCKYYEESITYFWNELDEERFRSWKRNDSWHPEILGIWNWDWSWRYKNKLTEPNEIFPPFMRWAAGEPREYNGDCIQFGSIDEWFVTDCDAAYRFSCRADIYMADEEFCPANYWECPPGSSLNPSNEISCICDSESSYFINAEKTGCDLKCDPGWLRVNNGTECQRCFSDECEDLEIFQFEDEQSVTSDKVQRLSGRAGYFFNDGIQRELVPGLVGTAVRIFNQEWNSQGIKFNLGSLYVGTELIFSAWIKVGGNEEVKIAAVKSYVPEQTVFQYEILEEYFFKAHELSNWTHIIARTTKQPSDRNIYFETEEVLDMWIDHVYLGPEEPFDRCNRFELDPFNVRYMSPLQYCEDSMLKTVEDGYFLNNLRSNQTACNKGNYCTTGQQWPCKRGTYQPNETMSFCFDCPKGYFCNEDNMIVPEPCEAGTFQPYTAALSCESCLPGNKCPLMNMTESTPCEPGTYQSEFGKESCVPCPLNTYCPYTNMTYYDQCPLGFTCPKSTHPEPCPSGQITPLQGASCETCPNGKYANSIATDCLTCNINHFCVNGIQEPCDLGTEALNEGLSECENCPVYFFRNESMDSCSQVPNGYTSENRINLTECEAGHKCVNGLSEECSPGTYQDETGKDSCKICEVHRFQDRKGRTKCKMSRKGTEVLTTGATQNISCAAGFYNPEMAEPCKICNPGFKCPTNGLINQISCEPGEYQDQQGSTDCKPCPLGHYCPAANMTTKIQCESGWIATSLRSTECTKCDVGFEEDKDMPIENDDIRCKIIPYGFKSNILMNEVLARPVSFDVKEEYQFLDRKMDGRKLCMKKDPLRWKIDKNDNSIMFRRELIENNKEYRAYSQIDENCFMICRNYRDCLGYTITNTQKDLNCLLITQEIMNK